MKKLVGFFILFIAFLVPNYSHGITLNINGEEIPKTNLLIYGLDSSNPENKKNIDQILGFIKYNLESTNLFIVNQNSQADLIVTNQANINAGQKVLNTEKIPDFGKYANLGISAMLIGDTAFGSDGTIEIRIRLWDIMDERQLFGKYYSTNKTGYKKMANVISNEIFMAITGEKSGHFDSQIAYVAESGTETKKIKRIALMDFDGSNHRYLTNGRDLVLTPALTKNPGEVIFMRWAGSNPQLYSLNINDSILKRLGRFTGTTFSPSVSPVNPNLILLSVIEGSGSNIYELDLLTGNAAKLTNNHNINTTPSYSPDGRKIIFSSDRDGLEGIYVMNTDGSAAKKISNGTANYSKPVWSPDGNLIAFTRMKSNQFGIGVMNIDGRNEKILTSGYVVEGAKWAPNGRYLIYSRKDSAYGRKSIPKLYMIDIITGFERELPTPSSEGASDPDWQNNW